jgi:hypothetical protein
LDWLFTNTFLGGGWPPCLSGGFENQDALVVQMNLGSYPRRAFVEIAEIGVGWIFRTVELPPAQELGQFFR